MNYIRSKLRKDSVAALALKGEVLGRISTIDDYKLHAFCFQLLTKFGEEASQLRSRHLEMYLQEIVQVDDGIDTSNQVNAVVKNYFRNRQFLDCCLYLMQQAGSSKWFTTVQRQEVYKMSLLQRRDYIGKARACLSYLQRPDLLAELDGLTKHLQVQEAVWLKVKKRKSDPRFEPLLFEDLVSTETMRSLCTSYGLWSELALVAELLPSKIEAVNTACV